MSHWSVDDHFLSQERLKAVLYCYYNMLYALPVKGYADGWEGLSDSPGAGIKNAKGQV
ncbi:hypothetical protein Bwad001_17700 [Bilophila wadsworthia]